MTITKDGIPGYHDRLGFLFLDFNAFFAAVEQLDDPSLRGRPVIVTPLDSEHTGAIAASYEARPYGIKRGTTLRDARRLCPGIAVRPARHDRYVAVHHAARAAIETVLPVAAAYSVDEMACRLAPSEGTPEAATDTARRVRAALDRDLGPTLRASIGLAQTRLLAKLAAERRKPDGLTVIEPGTLPGVLAALPLGDVPGIGPRMLVRLERAGVRSFEDLWAMQPKAARKLWGSVQGERFWYALHGWEAEETWSPSGAPRHMLGHSRVLDREHEHAAGARRVACALLMKAAARMRHHGRRATRLSCYAELRVPLPGIQAYEGEAPLPPTRDSLTCLRALGRLWSACLARLARAAGGRPLRFAKVSVQLSGLLADDDPRLAQRCLFAEPEKGLEAGPEERSEEAEAARRERLWAAVDALNADADGRLAALGGRTRDAPALGRYVTLAALQGLDLNYLGGKIAFSRVPDAAEFVM